MHTSIIDTHLHLYPNYELPRAFNALLNATKHLGEDKSISRIACLAERHDCNYFSSLLNGTSQLEGFTVKSEVSNELTITRNQDNLSLTVLPGRQIITLENIEVLALACSSFIEDNQPALDVIYQINRASSVPVIAWSPGKWFGKRGKLVQRLIDELEPQDFMIGDTTLRPFGWTTPTLMKRAKNKGFGVVAGSDPLPFNGEEKWLGAYYSLVNTQPPMSATELIHAMKQNAATVEWDNHGKRTNIFNLFNRLRKNAVSKKQAIN